MKRISYNNLASPDLAINGDTAAIPQERIVTSAGYDFVYSPIFSNAIDCKINNYSSLILTDRQTLGTFTEIPQINSVQPKIPSVQTAFDTIYLDTTLYSQNTQKYVSRNLSGAEWVTSADTTNNAFFTFEFIDTRQCRIFYLNEFSKEYLFLRQTNPGVYQLSSISDVSDINDNLYTFRHVWDSTAGKIQLCRLSSSDTIEFYDNNGTVELMDAVAISSGTPFLQPCILEVRKQTEDISVTNDNIWTVYSNDHDSSLKVDSERSYTDVKLNYLISGQYSAIETTYDLKVLQLKNFLNRNYLQGKGNYVFTDEYSPINYRNYTSIFSGRNEELGFENIILNYKSFFKEITIDEGETIDFILPSNIEPYSLLNINDTLIAESGQLYGKTPLQSDRILKKLNNKYAQNNLVDESVGTYLCTWLYKPTSGDPIWLDRYYYPQSVSPVDIIDIPPQSTNQLSYFTYVQNLSDKTDSLIENGFFDKKSELTFEQNQEYRYSRLSRAYFRKYKTMLQNNIKYSFDEMVCDGNTYKRIPQRLIGDNISDMTIDMFVTCDNVKKSGGRVIFSAMHDGGFALYNNPLITDISILQDSKSIRLYNQNGKMLNEYEQEFLGTPNIRYVFSNGMDSELIIISDQPVIKTTIDGGLMKMASVAITEEIRGSYYNFDENNLYIYTDDNIHCINYQTFDITSTPQASVKIFGYYKHIGDRLLDHICEDGIEKLVFDDRELFRCKSGTIIRRIQTDADHNLYLQVNDNILLFNRNGKLINRIKLDGYTVYDISAYRYSNGDQGLVQVLDSSDETANKCIILDKNLVQIREYTMDGAVQACPLTAFTQLKNYFGVQENNSFIFELNIKSFSKETDRIKKLIPINVHELGQTEHQFTFVFNLSNSIVNVFVNGVLVQSETIPIQPTSIYKKIGGIGFQYGLINDIMIGTSNLIKHSALYDITYMNNISISDFTIYNKQLTESELLVIGRQRHDIGDLCISLPAGYVNEFDTISTFYRVTLPYRKQNYIDIKVDGVDVIEQKSELLELIEETLSNEMQINTIKNIQLS